MRGSGRERKVSTLPMEAAISQHRALTGTGKSRKTGGARGLALQAKIIAGVRDNCPDAISHALTKGWNTRGST